MGDKKRFQVVSQFIKRNFPKSKYSKIADVAGGQGYLSLALSELGYECTVIDPRKTRLSKKERRKENRFERLQKLFDIEDAHKYDLIVGLHPDQATETIARAAFQLPCVILPCCNYWKGIESHGTNQVSSMIRNLWNKLGIDFRHTQLAMNGKNEVLWVS